MPQAVPTNGGDDKANAMASSMKTMNKIMPLMSAYFCFILPAGMGLYWVAGALVRSVQQIIVNKHLDKIDIDELTKKNMEKHKKKLEKTGIPAQAVNNYARMNTKKVDVAPTKNVISEEEKETTIKKVTENNKNAKPGSLAAKASMVKQYNEDNNK
jgi:YidC/Oxa1 family membrane protein insertase